MSRLTVLREEMKGKGCEPRWTPTTGLPICSLECPSFQGYGSCDLWPANVPTACLPMLETMVRALSQPSEVEQERQAVEVLAVQVVNLRRTLELAWGLLRERGVTLLPGCDEHAGPTFREGRKFWAQVRREKRDALARVGVELGAEPVEPSSEVEQERERCLRIVAEAAVEAGTWATEGDVCAAICASIESGGKP